MNFLNFNGFALSKQEKKEGWAMNIDALNIRSCVYNGGTK